MIWRSDHAPVEVGGATLEAMVRATAARMAGRPALVDGSSGNGVSYAELVGRAERVAARLAERGCARATCSRCGRRTSPHGRASRSARCAPASR